MNSKQTVADGFREYRVEKAVPEFYGWDCDVGDTLIFPLQDNIKGWEDVEEVSRCASAKMWVRALIGDGILVEITDTTNNINEK